MATPEIKKAALKLYTLNIEDRRWILRQLPPNSRESIKEKLNELKKLGIVKDKFVLNKIVDSERFLTRKTNSVSKGVNPEHIETINSATSAEVYSILKIEPLWITAIILSIDEWSWKSEYMSLLSLSNKSELITFMNYKVGEFPKNIIFVIIEELALELQDIRLSNAESKYTEINMAKNIMSKDVRQKSGWWRRIWQ